MVIHLQTNPLFKKKFSVSIFMTNNFFKLLQTQQINVR